MITIPNRGNLRKQERLCPSSFFDGAVHCGKKPSCKSECEAAGLYAFTVRKKMAFPLVPAPQFVLIFLSDRSNSAIKIWR